MPHSLAAFCRSFALSLIVLFALIAQPVRGEATPVYGLRSANACDTCHIEPSGWANPPVSERLCTMDCNICHVSPTGGGMRTPSGQYYGREILPTWGTRPSASARAEKYLPRGYPAKGRYRLFEGFEGWWPGQVPAKEIAERYGDIDPGEFGQGLVARVGGDVRLAVYAPRGASQDTSAFPMQAELYGMIRPFDPLTLYGTVGLQGSRSQLDVTGSDARSGYDKALDYLTVRELFVKVDRLPSNSWVRAGRFVPVYGWRLPDHTSFIRRDLGFDYGRQVFGVEGGWNPNYPVLVGSVFKQGLDAWPGDVCQGAGSACPQEGFGGAGSVGYRALGWQIMGNAHYLDRADGPADATGGISWGVNLYPLVYLGELDYRRTIQSDPAQADINGLFAYHELDLLVARGVNLKFKYDWRDADLDLLDNEVYRITTGVEWHPVTYVDLEFQYRTNLANAAPGRSTVGTSLSELLFIGHLWF